MPEGCQIVDASDDPIGIVATYSPIAAELTRGQLA